MNHLKLLLSLSFLFLMTISACTKKDCGFKSKYIYEPLVFDEACDCIVAGKVKYLKNCETAVLVDYGNGTCDNLATKTICLNGKCEISAGAYTEDFEFDCQEEILEGPISEAEALKMGI